MPTKKRASYGWSVDIPDQRDEIYTAPQSTELPPSVDLRPQCPPVYAQGELGSVTANAIAAAIQYAQMKQGIQSFMPSRLFIYYNARVMENTVESDAGAMLRDGLKSVAELGVPPEDLWPYVIAKFQVKPPPAVYEEAKKHCVSKYQRINQDINPLRACLAGGFPFLFGFSVYESFMSPEVAGTGHASLPDTKERIVGGHAVLAVGYNDKEQLFIARNSWGDKWGMDGYFTIPYTYVLGRGFAQDFWRIETVQG